MKYIINSGLIFIAIFILGTSIFTSCGSKETGGHEEHADTLHTEETEIKLTPEQIKAIGIELGTISYRNLKTTLKVNGRLELPPQNKAQVCVLIGGIVKEIPVMEGQFVNKGQVLAVLGNAEFLQTQQEYLENQSSLEFLKAEYERQTELQKENINAVKTYQQSKNNYDAAVARNNLYGEKLKLFGVMPETISYDRIKAS